MWKIRHLYKLQFWVSTSYSPFQLVDLLSVLEDHVARHVQCFKKHCVLVCWNNRNKHCPSRKKLFFSFRMRKYFKTQ